MSSSGMNMCMKTSVPLTYYITDYALLQATRQTQHALLQFINIINFHLVALLLLHFFQNSESNGCIYGLFGGHVSGEMKVSISHSRRLTISQEHCLARK